MEQERHDPQRLAKIFFDSVPEQVCQALPRCLSAGYADAWRQVKDNLDPRIWQQAWGYNRWLTIDSQLLAFAMRFREVGVVAKFKHNTVATHMKHTELQIGRVVLTAAAVMMRNDYPKEATYRTTLAESNQPLLFPNRKPRADHPLYVILRHVPNTSTRQPLHADITFPDGLRGWAADPLPLLELYPLTNTEREEVADLPTPKMVEEDQSGS